jgi:hypothetical protein
MSEKDNRQNGEIRVQGGARRQFPVKYTLEDLELLIEVDRAHQQLSGPATRRILQREWQVFGRREYAHLAEISAAHVYNLRHSVGTGSVPLNSPGQSRRVPRLESGGGQTHKVPPDSSE